MRVSLGAAVTAAVVAVAPPAAAQPGRSDVQEGNRLYREGRYDEAHRKYLEALRAAPDSPVIRFNDANALYQTEEFERAVDAYRGALEAADPVLEARAWYNLGNALYRRRQVADALEAYKQALRRNPGDTDAKHNLEVALERLRQQERQQRSDGSDPDSGQERNRREAGEDEPEPSPGERPEPQPSGERPEEEGPEDRQGQEPEEQEDREQEDGRQPEEAPAEPPNGEAEAQPRPGEMSREEAERLLQAISEDPGEIRRQRRSADPGRPARRPW